MMRAALPAAAGPLMCAALAVPALAQQAPGNDPREVERRTQQLREAVAPSVVSVRVTTHASKLPCLVFPGFTIAATGRSEERVEGAGFVLSARGLIVTTRELLRDAARVEVRFLDGTTRDASLLGMDAPFCVALLRTSAPESATPLPGVPRVEVERSVAGWFFNAATERSPDVDVQVTLVHAAPEQGAPYDRYLYAPVSIARGAAGGPLVGADGYLLGMAVGSLVARDEAQTQCTASRPPRATLFVRGDDIADAVRQIAAKGRIRRGILGTLIDGETNRIDAVLAGSPAQAAGLAEGDAIVGVGPTPVACHDDLRRALLRRLPGDGVKVTVERDGARFTKCVQLAEFEPPPEPTEPPVPGATIEASGTEARCATFTFTEVQPGSPAAKAGIAVGDRIVSVDGRSPQSFIWRHGMRVTTHPPAKIVVQRGDATVELSFAGE
jgi:S1-C subfamily serine protease